MFLRDFIPFGVTFGFTSYASSPKPCPDPDSKPRQMPISILVDFKIHKNPGRHSHSILLFLEKVLGSLPMHLALNHAHVLTLNLTLNHPGSL